MPTVVVPETRLGTERSVVEAEFAIRNAVLPDACSSHSVVSAFTEVVPTVKRYPTPSTRTAFVVDAIVNTDVDVPTRSTLPTCTFPLNVEVAIDEVAVM